LRKQEVLVPEAFKYHLTLEVRSVIHATNTNQPAATPRGMTETTCFSKKAF
jgi:hypothetical protein